MLNCTVFFFHLLMFANVSLQFTFFFSSCGHLIFCLTKTQIKMASKVKLNNKSCTVKSIYPGDAVA